MVLESTGLGSGALSSTFFRGKSSRGTLCLFLSGQMGIADSLPMGFN